MSADPPNPSLAWPLRAVPVLYESGRFPLDDQGFETTYRHATHALHLHDYTGMIEMDGRRLPLRPGTLTLSRARGRTRYDVTRPGHHWCVHFHPVARARATAALPCHLPAAAHRTFVAARLVEIARLHGQSADRVAQARAAVLLQELLLWIGTLGAAARAPRRADAAVDALVALIDERFAEPWTVPALAAAAGMGQDWLARRFRERLGVTVPRYLLRRRITHARELLLITDLPVNRIAARVGLPDAQHFNKQFRLLTGLSPSATRATA